MKAPIIEFRYLLEVNSPHPTITVTRSAMDKGRLIYRTYPVLTQKRSDLIDLRLKHTCRTTFNTYEDQVVVVNYNTKYKFNPACVDDRNQPMYIKNTSI